MTGKALFLFLFLTILNSFLFAQGILGGGSGTVADPYIINTSAHFAELSDLVNTGNDFVGKYLIMQNDIDFNNQNLTPIGNNFGSTTMLFNGHFDGQNHSITNFKSSFSEAGVGLFGAIGANAEVRNIHIASGNVSGSGIVGAVVGFNNGGHVYHCSTGSNVTVSTGAFYAGGVVGANDVNGTIERCVNKARVKGTGNAMNIGGITGASNGTITECCNFGEISGNEYVGGIVSYSDEGNIIRNCFNAGKITANSQYAGGIIGAIISSNSSTIENCYNYGSINCSSHKAAICAYCSAIDVLTNNYYDQQTSNATDANAGAQTTAVMTSGSFSGTLNFTTSTCWVEDINSINNNYPVFDWFSTTGIPASLSNNVNPIISSDDNEIIISFNEIIQGFISVYNLSGQLLHLCEINSTIHKIPVFNGSIYFIKISNERGAYIFKIFH